MATTVISKSSIYVSGGGEQSTVLGVNATGSVTFGTAADEYALITAYQTVNSSNTLTIGSIALSLGSNASTLLTHGTGYVLPPATTATLTGTAGFLGGTLRLQYTKFKTS